MWTTLVIAASGALGAASRHLLESFVNRHWGDAFPWGTFVVNVSGSFALGALVGLFAHRLDVPLWLQAARDRRLPRRVHDVLDATSLQIYRSTSTGHLAIAFANAFGASPPASLAVYAGILLAATLV